jgi:branched-chain amino acid transport system substrate-binding protein
MRLKALAIGLAAALTSLTGSSVARATGNDVLIGDIDDLSGLYADIVGPAAVEAITSIASVCKRHRVCT